MTIPLEAIGNITNTEHSGHRVRVQDDSANTGGYLIYEWWVGSEGPNFQNSFDSWVASQEDLERFFIEAGWVVTWPA